MGIGRALDRVMDWAMEGSSLAAFTKTMALAGCAVAALISPFVYYANSNNDALKQTIEEIDRGRSEIFNSVAACEARGYRAEACSASQKAAQDIARSLGTSVSYASAQDCFNHHGACSSQTVMVPITTMAGNVPITTYIPSTTHYPPVAGWQAASNDLNKAVPLYPTQGSQTLVRRDGRTFAP
ncbi:MAG: hypothetical protein ACK4PK_06420 [Alphaproteobacteria bacterium]|jgi:uncharacterized protein YgiB involved in biofilm formation